MASRTRNPTTKLARTGIIPDRNKYRYDAASMNEHLHTLKNECRRRKLEIPKTDYATANITQLLCNLASRDKKTNKHWIQSCDDTLALCLPLREHHRALISHSLFVTMTGSVVARALEEATYQERKAGDRPLDLLCDRYFVRNLLCHDSSKTSIVEASAYSGIMAVFMEKEEIAKGDKNLEAVHKAAAKDFSPQSAASQDEMGPILTSMANFGFKHHYETNNHHLEYYKGEAMADCSVIEAIIDGLACVLERDGTHSTAQDWIDKFYVNKFRNPRNLRLAKGVISALKTHITKEEYQDLIMFRTLVARVIGASTKWGFVQTTAEVCGHECTFADDRDLQSYFK